MNKSKCLKIQAVENQSQLVRVYVGLGAFMNKLKFKIIKWAFFSSCALLTCVYRIVVLMLLCPSSSWISLISVPFSKRCVAKLCRMLWIPPLVFTPAFFLLLKKPFVSFCIHIVSLFRFRTTILLVDTI